jgi:hypothetical protein
MGVSFFVYGKEVYFLCGSVKLQLKKKIRKVTPPLSRPCKPNKKINIHLHKVTNLVDN